MHKLVQLAKYVSEICQPFFDHYHFAAFCFSRIYDDGSRIELWSDADALENAFFKKKTDDKFATHNYLTGDERHQCLRCTFFDYPKGTDYKYLSQLFNHWDYFEKLQSFTTADYFAGFCELFNFYANIDTVIPQKNDGTFDLSFLKDFVRQFKADGADLISTATLYRIQPDYPLPKAESYFELRQDVEAQYTFSDQLTKREAEVAEILLVGKTAAEISNDLHISKRTVEHHIENIKEKTHCRKRSELIQFLRRIGAIK